MKHISFCLYGDDIKYYKGAEKNISLIKELLPDWTPVIYYSPSSFKPEYINILNELGGKLINVDTIEFSKYLTYPMFWRYLTFFESGYSIIRDLDSRISEREVKYINNWVNSDLDYFIIRDHPWHSLVPGGLVGLKLDNSDIKDFFTEFVKNNGLGWGTDQEMLSKYFDKIDKSNVFYCGFDDNTNYIKRDNLDFFIGIQLDENDEPIIPSATLALEFLKSINL
jgi:hypothetical protein